MNRRLFLGQVLALASGAAMPAALSVSSKGSTARSTGPFRIGVAPHSSARVILQMYQPLRVYLEKELSRPVEIVTAADFLEYSRRSMEQDYDLAIATGHLARLLETDAGYRPLLTYKADFLSVIVVDAAQPWREAADLANGTIIGLSPASLVTIWGQHWVKRNGVPNVHFRYVSASDSAAQLVLNGDGRAGVISLANYQNLRPEMRDRLRILDESLPMAGRVYMLAGRHAALRQRLLDALWKFSETPEARAYFERYRLEGYRALGPRELSAMDPYANEVRQVLKQSM